MKEKNQIMAKGTIYSEGVSCRKGIDPWTAFLLTFVGSYLVIGFMILAIIFYEL